MEPVVAFLDEEWDSLSRMFSTEEADHFSFGSSSTFWAIDGANRNMVGVEDGSLLRSNPDTNNLQYFSPESSNSSGGDGGGGNGIFFPVPTLENHHYYYSDSNHFQETNNIESMDFCAVDKLGINNLSFPIFPDISVMEDILCMKEEIRSDKLRNADEQAAICTVDPVAELQLMMKRKFDMPEAHAGAEDQNNDNLSETPPKKKSRVSRDAKQGKKSSTSKKNQKLMISTPNANDHHEEKTNGGTNGQSSSCCYSSEDDSNASQQELTNGGGGGGANSNSKALNSNGKTRASRRAATDPQSLYARKRRERINERLRILQNLVPNGTKVDISTMLEEAVHYVKFLQLQIKLLSSDELWMFAPIAYNGMDIGLCHKISPTL